MLVIGIVGGVASGKSTVAGHFQHLGAIVIDVDRVGHEVLGDREVREAARRRWGDGVFDSEGNIDRSAVGRIVFAAAPDGPEQLAWLEELTHPRIAERLRRQINSERLAGRAEVVVLDAAVLLKAGWDRLCDKVVLVDAPVDVRLGRVRQRGWSDEQFFAREAAQVPLELARRRADIVIDNSASLEQTKRCVEQFWRTLSE
jgi:dephospho-CoA kinase